MTNKRFWNLVGRMPSPIGIHETDELTRCERGLQRWAEAECGDQYGNAIERDEVTGKPFRTYERHDGKRGRTPIRDMEASYLRRIASVFAKPEIKAAGLTYYVQPDCRGCMLYVIRPGDVPAGASVDSCYTNGVAVCA